MYRPFVFNELVLLPSVMGWVYASKPFLQLGSKNAGMHDEKKVMITSSKSIDVL
jgi:hypothetical protein